MRFLLNANLLRATAVRATSPIRPDRPTLIPAMDAVAAATVCRRLPGWNRLDGQRTTASATPPHPRVLLRGVSDPETFLRIGPANAPAASQRRSNARLGRLCRVTRRLGPAASGDVHGSRRDPALVWPPARERSAPRDPGRVQPGPRPGFRTGPLTFTPSRSALIRVGRPGGRPTRINGQASGASLLLLLITSSAPWRSGWRPPDSGRRAWT